MFLGSTLFVILHGHACAHDFTVEHGVFMVLHKDGFYEYADFADVANDVGPLFPWVGDFTLWHDDGHVDVAVRVGIALGIGTVKNDLRLSLIARAYHLLVASDGVDGFVSGKRSSIHCVSSLVVSMMCKQPSLLSDRAAATFCSG